MTTTLTSLVARDARVLWHPFTQHATEPEPLPVARARDATLFLEDGTELLDGISSWWSILHGHGHPALCAALTEQFQTLDHVLFAGTTHAPAVELAESLVDVTPKGLERVFYSDNGSTSVEVALKMAYQYQAQIGESRRRTFLAFEGGYHGDTFGAMAVGDPIPFFLPFTDLLFDVERSAVTLEAVTELFERRGSELAAVIIEPMLQAAGGMGMQSPEFLRGLRALCDDHGVLLVADEVMTGFGRTGRMFACEHAGIAPDVLCLAKGLTGGTFPLSATLATSRIFDAFLSDERTRAFFHGHTFTANPVGCAVALASLKLCREDDVPARLERIGTAIAAELEDLAPRRLGGVVAVDLEVPEGEGGYLSSLGPTLRRRAVEKGVLLRPLGNVLYAMPPACTTAEEASRIGRVMRSLARSVEAAV